MKKELLHQKRDSKGHYTKASHIEKPKLKVRKVIVAVKKGLSEELIVTSFMALLNGAVRSDRSIKYLGYAIYALLAMDAFIVFWIVTIFKILG